MIRKYGLNMSRQAFREKAADIGFVKVRCGATGEERGMRADDVCVVSIAERCGMWMVHGDGTRAG